MVSHVSIAFYPLGFEVGKRDEQRSTARAHQTARKKKQGPAAGNIWIPNNTAEQNTHLGIGEGQREAGFMVM